MPNRSKAPQLTHLSLPKLMSPVSTTLSNGVVLHVFNDPSQDVFRLDVHFEAGACYQPRPLIASTTIHMLNEGTLRHTSAQIAEIFDYYGAYADFVNGLHKAEATVFSLTKYAGETIPLLGEMIQESIFPENELEIYIDNRRQHFLTEQEKTSWLARKEVMKLLFGPFHPYANSISEDDYGKVSREMLLKYYKAHINARNCRIFLTGNITDTIYHRTEQVFSQLLLPDSSPDMPFYPFEPSVPGYYHVPKEGAVQSSIRIAQQGVSLTDEDYAGFLLLNTVLGGYFGSRLMSNIREEKGYTYGINSFNISLPMNSYWCVATDVNRQYTGATIDEVLKEINRLRTEEVTTDELSLVKNFLYGDLLREVDGVFAQADAFKHKLLYGTDNNFYLPTIEKIRQYSPRELLEMAVKHLHPEKLFIVTAGDPEYSPGNEPKRL